MHCQTSRGSNAYFQGLLLVIVVTGIAQAGYAAEVDGLAPSGGGDESQKATQLFKILSKAQTAIRDFDYPEAARLYEQITGLNPHHGDYWLRLARCQERLGQYERAISSFERGLALGDDSAPGHIQYQIALVYARLQDASKAIDWLERSLAARHEHRSVLRTDKRWDFLRDEERFARLAADVDSVATLSREQRWSRDLDHLAEEAARMHPQWREGDRPERFRQAIEELRQRISSLDDQRMLTEVQRIVVLLGDGHSHVGARGSVPVNPRLPLQMYFFRDGLFVIDADGPHRDLIGCRIDRIGNCSVEEVTHRLEQLISRDNPMGIKAIGPSVLTDPVRLQALGIIDGREAVPLVVTDRAGARREVVVEPGGEFSPAPRLKPSKLAAHAAPPRYLHRIEENLWFEPLPEIDSLYVQFNEVGNQKDRQLADVAQKLRAQLTEHPPKALVIDVRHNGGGNTYLYAPLLKALMYYELTQPDGKIFALIGRHTFSAAQNFTNDVDRLTDAIFVGEPSGSRPNFTGESTEVLLPYSGVGVSISTRFHAHSYATDRRIWVAPDVPAELSSADYFDNRDPALAAVAAIMRDQQADK